LWRVSAWGAGAKEDEDKLNYRYFEKEGAIFRALDGVRFVQDVKHDKKWMPYSGDVFAPMMFGNEITAARADDLTEN